MLQADAERGMVDRVVAGYEKALSQLASAPEPPLQALMAEVEAQVGTPVVALCSPVHVLCLPIAAVEPHVMLRSTSRLARLHPRSVGSLLRLRPLFGRLAPTMISALQG